MLHEGPEATRYNWAVPSLPGTLHSKAALGHALGDQGAHVGMMIRGLFLFVRPPLHDGQALLMVCGCTWTHEC